MEKVNKANIKLINKQRGKSLKSNMSRKPSFETDLSMSVRVNYPSKDYLEVHSYKKSPKHFDKYSSQVLDRNDSQ